MEYAEQVIEGIRQYFNKGDHDYVQDIRLHDDKRTITVTFYDWQSDSIRDMEFDIYDDGLNTSGHDYPEAVGALIAIHVDEEEGAVRRKR
jgi:hypothetical protein